MSDKNKNSYFELIKTKRVAISFALIFCVLAFLIIQNVMIINQINNYHTQSQADIHKIYDDTKIVKAYLSGSKDGLNEKETFIYDTLKNVISEVIQEDMSDYEKEKAIYDWQFNWVNFSQEGLDPIQGETDDYTPYGVLKGHKAICVGNATTFKLFMDALEIPCKIIHSTTNGEHAWNVVQLENDWYHVDLTFDEGMSKPAYTAFNVTDSMKEEDVFTWNHDEIPVCNGSKYCYLLMNAAELDNMYDIPSAIAKTRDEKDSLLGVVLKDEEGFNSEIAQYIASSVIVENGMVIYDGVYTVGGKTIYKYEIKDMTSEEMNDIDQKVKEKLQQKIDDANTGMDPDKAIKASEYMMDDMSSSMEKGKY